MYKPFIVYCDRTGIYEDPKKADEAVDFAVNTIKEFLRDAGLDDENINAVPIIPIYRNEERQNEISSKFDTFLNKKFPKSSSYKKFVKDLTEVVDQVLYEKIDVDKDNNSILIHKINGTEIAKKQEDVYYADHNDVAGNVKFIHEAIKNAYEMDCTFVNVSGSKFHSEWIDTENNHEKVVGNCEKSREVDVIKDGKKLSKANVYDTYIHGITYEDYGIMVSLVSLDDDKNYDNLSEKEKEDLKKLDYKGVIKHELAHFFRATFKGRSQSYYENGWHCSYKFKDKEGNEYGDVLREYLRSTDEKRWGYAQLQGHALCPCCKYAIKKEFKKQGLKEQRSAESFGLLGNIKAKIDDAQVKRAKETIQRIRGKGRE